MPYDFLDRFRLEHPVVQAGMGGGVAGPALASAVSGAGALGTLGMRSADALAAALGAASRAGRPVAANLLVPFLKPAHVRALIESAPALVVVHGGCPGDAIRRLEDGGVPVFVTVGGAAAARRALAAGAHGLVAQGVEAGGHLVAAEPLDRVLPAVLEAAGHAPVLAAGGVADSGDVRRLVSAGAVAAVAGTRFLLTEESGAHPEYKRRVAAAERTFVTELFGLGWPLKHRVIANAATDRWCSGSPLGSGWIRRLNRLSAPLGGVLALDAVGQLAARQRPRFGLFSPALPTADMPLAAVDRTALYAGETVSRLGDVITAAQAVAALAP